MSKHFNHSRQQAEDAAELASPPRIIGGTMGGRKLLFQPDPRTRPMKERVREALFNLLGPNLKGTHAIDLFAGTGALGFEAISRGAISATFVERHFPTADRIKESAAGLELTQPITIIPGNSMLWTKRMPELPTTPWVVFVSPPYDLFIDNEEGTLALVSTMMRAAPQGSLFAVESDIRFDMQKLPDAENWIVREHQPAILAVWRDKSI